MGFKHFKQTAIAIVLLTGFATTAQTIRYVRPDGTGNGLSWATASGNIQAMINASSAGDKVWVARGTYQVASNVSMSMKQGVAILGGFPAGDNAATMAQRNPAFNVTTIRSVNTSVFKNTSITSASLLDGFTITCSSTQNSINGGGMHNTSASPTISNCIFSALSVTGLGGGMYNTQSSPIITNCIFRNNSATGGGGGIYNISSVPTVTNCLFHDNQAANGAGVYNANSGTPKYLNCTFTRNTAVSGGGALYASSNSPTANNCIFWNNLSTNNVGNEIAHVGGYVSGQNCVITPGSASISGSTGFSGTLSADPLFSAAFSLTDASPAKNAGNNSLYPDAVTATDLAANPRLTGSQIDIGAYESALAPSGSVRYVRQGGTGNGSSWQYASPDLQAMINSAASGGEVWVAKGTYQPASGQSFIMKEGVAILGGFPNENNAAVLAHRNPALFTTNLRGNANSVIRNSNLTSASVLDGFSIYSGNAGSGNGGGIYNNSASPTIKGCIIHANSAAKGGAIYNQGSSPNISNCLIANNSSTGGGGGVYNTLSSPTFTNCLLRGNQAANGGAAYNENSGTAKYLNCTFTKNSATSTGGALYTGTGTDILQNTILWNNVSPVNAGSELYNVNGTISAANCLITITSATVVGTFNHQGTVSGNPLFTDTLFEIYTLSGGSPAINAGNTALYSGAATAKDLEGNPRLAGPQIDLGAYEFKVPSVWPVSYVKQGGTGDGSSWASASGDLQGTINACAAGNEVWVAQGTYQPGANLAFVMKEGVIIRGGFPNNNNSATMEQRNPAAHPTVLKANNQVIMDNENLTTASVLDGFTLSDAGYGAMYNDDASPTIVNCTFANNSASAGGGIFNWNSSPVISYCTFINNSSSGNSLGGGAIFNYEGSSPKISNCTFSGNSAYRDGGAIGSYNSSPTVINCKFSNNTAGNIGGGVSGDNGPLIIINCLFHDNQAPYGGALATFGSGSLNCANTTFTQNTGTSQGGAMYIYGYGGASLYNCIVWDNYNQNGNQITLYSSMTAKNCLLTPGQPSISGTLNHQGTITANPLFTDAANNNFTLSAYSPAVNSGDNALYPATAAATDVVGNSRIAGPKIDLGPYESSYLWPAASGNIHYVKEGGTGNGANWEFASGSIQEMIDLSLSGHEIWVQAGTYFPTARAGNGTEDRDKAIVLKNNVSIYGGFAGTETSLGQRDWNVNTTVLSGDIGVADDDSDNAYHVIISAGTVSTAVVDGFTITRGNANVTGQISVNGSTLNRNDGAGIYAIGSSPKITNCIIKGNIAANRGAGTFSDGVASQPIYTNCLLNGNRAVAGGGMYANNQSQSRVINCTISGNYAFNNGGGIHTGLNATATIHNSIVWGNDALFAPGNELYSSGGGSVTAGYSIIKNQSEDITGAFNGLNMVYNDPLFVSGGFSLQATSPALNAGNTAHFTGAETARDLAGNVRLKGASIDIGAYEINTDCTITTIWAGNGWSNGEPVSVEYHAVINGDYNSADDGEIAACSLTVNSGNVVIAEGHNFIIKRALAIDNDSASFTIKHKANLIQVDDVDNIGNIHVIKESAPMYRLDYALWGSPVAGQKLKAFSPQTLDNRFYTYNPLSDGYSQVQSPATTDFVEGKGYLIRVANNHPAYVSDDIAPTRWTGTFTGVPNNGNVDLNVIPSSAGVDGFNAISNPYPSSINIKAFFDANQNNLAANTPIYFWRKKNEAGTSSYCSLTLAGYTANTGNDFGDSSEGVFSNPNNSENWAINSGQGFIVKATGNTVIFRNDMRVAENYGQMFRTAQDASDKSRLWLNLTNTEGAFGQAMIAYTPTTTLGLDYGWDGQALTDGNIAIYSLAGESKLGIQARPAFDAADEVPMEVKVTTAGQYTISLAHFDGVFAEGQQIYLRDNVLGITHNLQAPYNFMAEAGTINGRFYVVYAEALGTDKPVFDSNSIIVYKQDNALNISTGNLEMKSVAIYDVRGRLLYSSDNINAAETSITTLQAQEQMLIVQITTVDGLHASRKIVF